MFLARDEIVKLAQKGELIGKDYDPDSVRQASYDLRLGKEYYIVGHDVPEKLSEKSPYLSLAPGQFAILTCLEEIKMPRDHMAFIALRSTFKFQGLVNISGFHVDPTHEGTLLFAVQNVSSSDIRLKFKERTFTIFFAQLLGNIEKSREAEAVTQYKPGLRGIQLQHVQLLGGASVTIAKLQRDLDQLRRWVLIYGPIIVAVLIALIVNLIRNWGPPKP
jgi:dCTP deaminase